MRVRTVLTLAPVARAAALRIPTARLVIMAIVDGKKGKESRGGICIGQAAYDYAMRQIRKALAGKVRSSRRTAVFNCKADFAPERTGAEPTEKINRAGESIRVIASLLGAVARATTERLGKR